MSAIKVVTQNINIMAKKIANDLAINKRYEEYGKDVIEKIALEVVGKYEKALLSNKDNDEVIFDDEELFDETYDYMLKKLNEVFSSADIAYIVNDVFMQVEDMLFDQGRLQYEA